MSDPIRISFRWSLDELLTAQRVHMKYSADGRKYRRYLIWGILLSVFFGGGMFVTHGFTPIGFTFIVFGVTLSCSPLLVRRIAIKDYARRPDRDMLVSYEFFEDHITNKNDASFSTLEWRMISRVLQSKRGFLFYPNDRSFHWIPAHGFQNGNDFETLAQLARAKIEDFEQAL